jgi:hypothetical protein
MNQLNKEGSNYKKIIIQVIFYTNNCLILLYIFNNFSEEKTKLYIHSFL